MTALLLFAFLFFCGLVNSYFLFPHPKSKLFLSWFSSLLPMASAAKAAAIHREADQKKKEKEINKEEAANGVSLESIFATFDRDGDGFITLAELEESLKRLGLFGTSQEVVGMMERVDANGDGLIDLEEFRNLYDSMGRRSRQEGPGERRGEERAADNYEGEEEEDDGEEEEMDLREAFDVFDGNRDGLITVEELGKVLTSLGLKHGEKAEDCRDMISKVDMDGDGMVNFEEFKRMMTVKGNKLF